MGYKARNKQAPPQPLGGSDFDGRRGAGAGAKSKGKGKKKASSSGADERRSVKAARGPGAKSIKDNRRRNVAQGPRKKQKGVDVEDEDDSDLEDALRPG
jgi:hypothetical protein